MTRPTIDPEFAALMPPQTAEERARLRAKLLKEGFRDSLVVWKEAGILLDGHNRLEECEALGIAYTADELSFPTREDALLWVIDNQLGKRDLTDETKAYLLGKEYLTHKKAVGNPHEFPHCEGIKNETAEAIAAKHGVGRATVERNAKFAAAVDKIAEAGGEAVRREILSGKSGKTRNQIVASVMPPKPPRKPKPGPPPTAPAYCGRCQRFVDAGGQPVANCLQCHEARKGAPGQDSGDPRSLADAIIKAVRDLAKLLGRPVTFVNPVVAGVEALLLGDVASPAPIPPELDTPEFRAAWQSWLNERRARKLGAYTPSGAAGQLKKLAKIGPARATAAIEYSIPQGYQGIIEDGSNGKQQRARPDRRTREHTPLEGGREGHARTAEESGF